MGYKSASEINPWTDNGKTECPFNCVGCPHLLDIQFYSKDDIEIDCDLED